MISQTSSTLQDEITQSVICAIEPSVRLAEIERSRLKPTDNLDAYDLYLRALPEFHHFTEQGLLRAEALVRRAVEIDPSFSDAWAALADCISRLYNGGWRADIEAVTKECCEAASRAVTADPDNGMALASAAWCFSIYAGQHAQAVEFADRAIRLNPHAFFVHSRCGWALVHAGEQERAVASFDAALRLSPVDPERYMPLAGKAAALFFMRQFEEAAEWAERAHLLKPLHAVSLRFLAASHLLAGRSREASEAIQKLLLAWPSASLRLAQVNTRRFRFPWMVDLYVAALREAGLPE